MSKTLSRRLMLRGIGKTAIALPVLEIMLDSKGALAQSAPTKRFFVMFDGQSVGPDFDNRDFVIPATAGANYEYTEALKPIQKYNVKPDISVVTGLSIPITTDPSVPASMHPEIHHNAHRLILHGNRMNGYNSMLGADLMPGADQIVADAIGMGTTYKTLNYMAQYEWYLSEAAFDGRQFFTFRKNSAGRIELVPNVNSPQRAFNDLFGSFAAPDSADAKKVQAELLKRKSILDLVLSDRNRLLRSLGVNDQMRVSQHFDEVRDLEKRIQILDPSKLASACKAPANPGTDPGVIPNIPAYTNEEARSKTFCDLIHMAFVCDLTRSATLMVTACQSHMGVQAVMPNVAVDQHELGHSGAGVHPNGAAFAMSQMIGWHVDHFSYLVNKLKNTPEGAGNILDNTAGVFCMEGGHGPNLGTDASNPTNWTSHNYDRMVMLVAGRAGGLKPGSHIVATNEHPSRVMLSAMQAVGVTGGFGQMTGRVSKLFG